MSLPFFSNDKRREQQIKADAFAALSHSQAIISFDPAGNVLDANELFLSLMGYELHEVRGHQHRLFVEQAYADSKEYEDF